MPMPSKRVLSHCDSTKSKKPRVTSNGVFKFNRIASMAAATEADENPPLEKLVKLLVNNEAINPTEGEIIIYWMRMEDMRIFDNCALSRASRCAQENSIPLVVLFILSPQDYIAHDLGPRKVDFTLRNLSILKHTLAELHIPLHTIVHTPRRSLPEKVVSLAVEWKACHIFANIEYEVDELRRDIATLELCRSRGIVCTFTHDRCIVPPGILKTKQNKPYSVYSPWLKNWVSTLRAHPEYLTQFPPPEANPSSVRNSPTIRTLFSTSVPSSIDGFECADEEKMKELWPAGTAAAMQVLDMFLHTAARRTQIADSSPLAPGAENSSRGSRVAKYADHRNRIDFDSSSRMSPYLSSGVISARECIRKTFALTGKEAVQIGRDNGVGMWVQEVAWRDFFMHVLAAFPRCSMGRPYLKKYADIEWEVNDKHLQAWKDGKTGVPIVDAGMRQLNTQGWMHNRSRMIVAMFLTKDLLLDWRLGEEYFMENLIDGDLASNNGGWQWSASTGVDAQPYFRVFNPILQSEKADPNGDYIRHFVPELRKLKGKCVHDPHAQMQRSEFEKLGYPKPIVKHKEAKDRAIRRYKNVGGL